MLYALLFTAIFLITALILLGLERLIQLEIQMSALTDAVAALTAAVAANTVAVAAVPNSSDAAAATKAVSDATVQLDTNNQTLAGDVAPAA